MSASQPIEWTVAQLAQAVERGQLELHYQPIVDLRSEQIVGAEALLRWRHPTLGLLPPGQFLPVIESSGLMPEIGAWVLGAACRQMRDWRVLAWQPFRLAVNVSASQVGPDFDKWVKGVLADAGLPAAYLEIELTESVAFGDPAIFPALEALRQIGVRFAADDFGTGYSCLQHLKCCPISTLKIDQSFVAGLANDHRDQTIVRTVIQLAHGLGMEVVAEGVETSASLDLLRQADCDTGQGFLFAKPMPAAAFAVFVSQWRGATMNANDPTATSCCVCCKEIPLDAAFTPEGAVSFSEDDCTIQRGLKPLVHTAPDSQISGLLCTKLVYAQYSCAPKRDEHGDRYRTDYRARRGHPARTGMGACASSRGDHWAVGAVGDGWA